MDGIQGALKHGSHCIPAAASQAPTLVHAAGETEEEAAAKRARLESEAHAGAAAGPADEQHAAGQARRPSSCS